MSKQYRLTTPCGGDRPNHQTLFYDLCHELHQLAEGRRSVNVRAVLDIVVFYKTEEALSNLADFLSVMIHCQHCGNISFTMNERRRKNPEAICCEQVIQEAAA